MLADLDRQINDIQFNGVEGRLGRMQAQDDALGIAAGNVAGEAVPRVGNGGLSPLAGPPRGYGDDPNLRQAHSPGTGLGDSNDAMLVASSAHEPGQDSGQSNPPSFQKERLPAGQPTERTGSGVKWGQLGKGALITTGGGLATATGVILCSTTGAGCIAGAPLAVFGANDAIQGATMINDAWHGRFSEGYNLLKSKLETWSPRWGGFAYDAGEVLSALGGLAARTPLIVDPAVTGIGRTKTLFGVAVPRLNNSVRVPIVEKLLDSNAQRGILGVTVGTKAYQAGKDYPED